MERERRPDRSVCKWAHSDCSDKRLATLGDLELSLDWGSRLPRQLKNCGTNPGGRSFNDTGVGDVDCPVTRGYKFGRSRRGWGRASVPGGKRRVAPHSWTNEDGWSAEGVLGSNRNKEQQIQIERSLACHYMQGSTA